MKKKTQSGSGLAPRAKQAVEAVGGMLRNAAQAVRSRLPGADEGRAAGGSRRSASTGRGSRAKKAAAAASRRRRTASATLPWFNPPARNTGAEDCLRMRALSAQL